MNLFPENWSQVFALQTPLLELIARGAAMYFGIIVLMRLMPRRSGGELAMMDLIFALLIADAAAHALGSYTSVTDGIILVITIMACNYLINTLSYRVRFIERLVSAPPLQIIRDGQLLRRNMRRELLTEEELMSYLRQQGFDRVEEVKAAYVEGEGKITVISRKSGK
ncbi:DUF421 domain-containing protein [Geobacter sp. DSM 9736]|uniref:DUF421 domain-containing protein n=1 Tax=Geobacter sp. DSM 9736 TaxID=1277350 RepID=UPI000B5035E2|nr:YetF domain-containing protein [Geobacter sp. DSM 9736]SNB46255.1 Protein of unknown function [Geobacter sp. DSM 9736]